MSSDELGRPGAPEPDDESWNDASTDLSGMNMFTQEIENVDASDWDVDSESLWGDEETNVTIDIGDGVFDTDFLS